MIYEIKIRKPPNKCPHGRTKYYCRECEGGAFCIHDKDKRFCQECGGSALCIHNKQKKRCRECGGNGLCIHNKDKYQCKTCCGSSVCSHGKIRHNCRLCGGSVFCIHNKYKTHCRLCGGSVFCIHDKQKTDCRLCDGSAICVHNNRRRYCQECNGSCLCIHGKDKRRCRDCDLFSYLANIQRTNLKRVMKLSNLEKTKPSIEYLGCSAEYFKDYIQSKMVEGMVFENIHLDHIKPVSKFDLSNIDALLDCCHYTNFQPLLAKDNLEKSDTWNEIDEIFWNENIKGKEYIPLYIPKK